MQRHRLLAFGAVTALLLSCAIGRPPGNTVQPALSLASIIPPEDPGLAETAPAQAPFQLTSSDGTGLTLVSVTAEASIEDPLALTQLHLVFDNPEDRTLEGRFTFTLPEGAAMSRFAMLIQGKWQEAEVVEKQRARETYEAFLHRRVDPALLEQGAGNEFSVRIFPIMPRQRKEIVVTYSETLGRGAPYRMRLAGLAAIGRLDARVYTRGALIGSVTSKAESPASDLVVSPPLWSEADAAGVHAGTAVVARVRVPDEGRAEEPFESALVLVDTSASRALDLGREIAALRTIVKSLPAGSKLRVACFDQSVRSVFEGTAGGFDESVIAKIKARRALGASDLGRALRWAAHAAKAAGSSRQRLIVMSDGVVTSGDKEAGQLAALTKALGLHGVVRADAVAVGGIQSSAALASIAQGQLATDGVVVGLEHGIDVVTKKLSTKTLAALPLAVQGATWSYPKLVSAQPGDDVLVFAELAQGGPGQEHRSVVVTLGEHTVPIELGRATPPLVHRAVAQAKISEVEADDDAGKSARKSEAIALSIENRIISRYTSMLVLETDRDYERFAIDRTAKVDVLAVRGGRVELLSQARDMDTDAAASITPTTGLGASGFTDPSIGDIGTIGAGSGSGAGSGARGPHEVGPGSGASKRVVGPAPQVRMGASGVSGRMPPEVIQRIVRQNFGRFRRCYQQGLMTQPDLAGRVVVRFVIGAEGSVTAAQNADSTLPSASVVQCVVSSFLALTFSPPESGRITVTYPLQFAPDGAEPKARSAPPTSLNVPVPARARAFEREQNDAPASEPYTGTFASIMKSLASGERDKALLEAWKWRAGEPTNVLSFVALGEAAEARGDRDLAARAYGSILELWSYRVDMRRFAGERLERLGDAPSLALAEDAYEGAVDDRPDHPSSHRLRAMALLRLGRSEEAFDALDVALTQRYAPGRFNGAIEVLREDLGIAAAAWLAKEPDAQRRIASRLTAQRASLASKPSLRFVLVWETDTNDVDLHVTDQHGEHAYHAHRSLASGGVLRADVTNGYGPEAFSITRDTDSFAFPYKLQVHYFSRGSMGFGMGKVQIIRHDGRGALRFEERPFVLMRDEAMVDLGSVHAL